MVWKGEERRKWDRRSDCSSGVCMFHNGHEEDDKEHRKTTCDKIKQLKAEHDADVLRLDGEISKVDTKVDSIGKTIVGKYWFHLTIGGLAGFMILGMGYLGISQNWAFTKILANQTEFSLQLNQVENNQIVITEKVRNLERAHNKVAE
jgi:hypothetical protein